MYVIWSDSTLYVGDLAASGADAVQRAHGKDASCWERIGDRRGGKLTAWWPHDGRALSEPGDPLGG